jgi:hypothetical protein
MLRLSRRLRIRARTLAVPTGLALSLAAALPAAGAEAAADSLSLLWPTEAGRCITGTFCEFRPGHFHSGLDVSTAGKTGFRCFAVADGEVARARYSCGGYGRAVYVKLADGRTAVYAHLSRFAGALAESVRVWQEAAGSMYFDRTIDPGVFPVRRGDVVAYTGQSGVGVPHLHFELRDAEERPLDPLRQGLRVADTTPPRITRVALTPLGPLASVDGRSDTVILDVQPGESPGRGRVLRAVPVEGEIGIAVEVHETTDGCSYRLAPARLELREDGDLLYGVDYSRISFAEADFVDFQIDPRFSYGEVGRFHRLWRETGSPLSVGEAQAGGDGVQRAQRLPESDRELLIVRGSVAAPVPPLPCEHSIQKAGEKQRELTIVAEDAAGNRAGASLVLSFAPPPSVTTLAARFARSQAAVSEAAPDLAATWADTLIVSGTVRAPGRELVGVDLDYSLDFGRTWHDGGLVPSAPDRSFHSRLPFLHRIPGEGRQNVLLRAVAMDVLGAASIPKTVVIEGSVPPPQEPPDFEIVTLGRWIELRFAETIPWGAVGGGWLELERLDGAGVLTAVLVRPWGRGVRLVLLPGTTEPRKLAWPGNNAPWRGYDPWGRPVPLDFVLPAWTADEATSGRATSPQGLAAYEFSAGAFRERVSVLVDEEAAPLAPGGMRPLGPLHTLLTGQVPSAGAYRIRLTAESPADSAVAHAGIFVQEPGGFRYIGGERDAELGGWVAETRTPLPVGLYDDPVAPRISQPRLRLRDDRTVLRFRVEDEGAGVDCDGIQVLCAGVPILNELDDETGDVVAYPPFAPGERKEALFILRVTDRCGNRAERTETVGLK